MHRQLRPLLPCVPIAGAQHAAPIQGWTLDQMAQLHRQVHVHAQLLIQGCALARLMSNAGNVGIAHIPCVGDVGAYSALARSLLASLKASVVLGEWEGRVLCLHIGVVSGLAQQ